MSFQLNLTIQQTLNNLEENIKTLTESLLQIDADSKTLELSNILIVLKLKVDEIINMYNDVNQLKLKVDNVNKL